MTIEEQIIIQVIPAIIGIVGVAWIAYCFRDKAPLNTQHQTKEAET